ncbi:MAG: inosine/xanthosine triphosphatase [Bacteroidetes bacterium]|nr:inosine/xanthosine triphosphatase [Bacteroidota bacterium]
MKIIVGSTNPVKNACVEKAFKKVFPHKWIKVKGLDAESGVSNQPMGNEETLMGAINRSRYCRNQKSNADFWVGIEGGCKFRGRELEAFAWMVVKTKTKTGKARTASFFLPNEVARLVKEGLELGDADDMVFARKDSKQENGEVGILTHDLIVRTTYYEQAMVLALIPFMNEELFI